MDNKLGQLLEEVRIEKNLSLREAASLTGLGHSYIRDLELGINRKTGKKVVPSFTSLKKLADAYHLNIYQLLVIAGFIETEDFPENAGTETIPLFSSLQEVTGKKEKADAVVYFPLPHGEQPDFAVNMTDDGLIDIGIYAGDVIYFRNAQEPEFNGQLVLARLLSQHEVVVRRITWSNHSPGFTLIAENKNYRPLDVAFHKLEILGVYHGHFSVEK